MTRLDEIPGISVHGAQVILAEIGLDMTRFPTAGAPGVVGETVPAHHPVRGKEPLRQGGQGQPLPQRRPRRDRRRGRQNRHLPRRALPADRETPGQAEGPRRGRPLPSWSSSGTCSPTPPSATTTSAPATTPAAPTPAARPATTSGSWKHSGTPSPSPQPPDPYHLMQTLTADHWPGSAAARQVKIVIFRSACGMPRPWPPPPNGNSWRWPRSAGMAGMAGRSAWIAGTCSICCSWTAAPTGCCPTGTACSRRPARATRATPATAATTSPLTAPTCPRSAASSPIPSS